MVVEDATITRNQYDIALVDLAFAALAAGLDHGLGERGHAPQVVARQLAAAGIARGSLGGGERFGRPGRCSSRWAAR
jgi:hypothetical protein